MGQFQIDDIVKIKPGTTSTYKQGVIVDMAPSGLFAIVQFKDGTKQSFHLSQLTLK